MFVWRQAYIHEFVGSSIPGIVAIVYRDYEKAGKWSGSIWTLRFAPGAGCLVSKNDWETGNRFHAATSFGDVVAEFRARGCTAPDETIIAALKAAIPRTMARIQKSEDALVSVQS